MSVHYLDGLNKFARQIIEKKRKDYVIHFTHGNVLQM